MNLSEEQIQQIQDMASALLPASEIAILLGLSAQERTEFCEIIKNHTNSEVYMAFHTGRLTTKFELRKTVIKLAKHGSPAAEPIAEKYLREQMI